jgi:acetolactate synthase regulatory subunit
MKAGAFWRVVVADEAEFLDRILKLLDEQGIRYCAIGGQAVNAYADPLVSLDLDIVVAADQIEGLEAALAGVFQVERFPHSINVAERGSDLRLQIQTDVPQQLRDRLLWPLTRHRGML